MTILTNFAWEDSLGLFSVIKDMFLKPKQKKTYKLLAEISYILMTKE